MKMRDLLRGMRAFSVVALLVALVACGGCNSGYSRNRNVPKATHALPTTFPATRSHWQGIDRVEFVERIDLADYQRVVVLPLETAATPLPDDETRDIVLAFLPKATGVFTAGFARSVKGVPVATGPAPKVAPKAHGAVARKADAAKTSTVKTGAAGAAPAAKPAPKAPAARATAAKPAAKPAATAPRERVLLVRAKVVEMNPGSAAMRYMFGNFAAGAARAGIEGEVVDATTGRTLLRFRDTHASGRYERAEYDKLLARHTREVGADVGVALGAFAAAPKP